MILNTGTWAVGITYQAGDKVNYNGLVYECVQPHTAHSSTWTPDSVPMWQKIGVASQDATTNTNTDTNTDTNTNTGEILEWSGNNIVYRKGDKVKYQGFTFKARLNNHVSQNTPGWEPNPNVDTALWKKVK